jgi:hypothetical protein
LKFSNGEHSTRIYSEILARNCRCAAHFSAVQKALETQLFIIFL